MKKTILCMGAIAIFLLAACTKSSETSMQPGNEIRQLPPGTLTTGGPFPTRLEWAFGNALQAGIPCQIAYATCGVWEPGSPPVLPLPDHIAPGQVWAIDGNNLMIDLDGTQLNPVIQNQAYAGQPFVLQQDVLLPQSVTDAAFAQAGYDSPGPITIEKGDYASITPGIPWNTTRPKPNPIQIYPIIRPGFIGVGIRITF
jgi:hypothetical protein